MMLGLGLNAQYFGRIRSAKAGCNPEALYRESI